MYFVKHGFYNTVAVLYSVRLSLIWYIGPFPCVVFASACDKQNVSNLVLDTKPVERKSIQIPSKNLIKKDLI